MEQCEVEDALYAAAVANGLVADDSQRQAWAAIRSGISAGLQDPITLNDNTRSPGEDHREHRARRSRLVG